MDDTAGAERPSVEPPWAPDVRFEATVHPGRQALSPEGVADFDLDRVPDPEGAIRVLLTSDDAMKLVSQGYEVRLVQVLPVQPLDAGLVADERATLGWLEEQVKGIPRGEAP